MPKAPKAPTPLKSAAETRAILKKLERQHPGADTELNYSSPYELLVATILSAQCTDERVNQVTPALFRRYPDGTALARATTDELEPQILSTGFFRAKSKSLLGMATAVRDRYRGEIPTSMEELTDLPGVGRKTANVVLGHALGVPGLPVDRHVLRVANRIGIASSDDPVVVEQQLGAALPAKEWIVASDTLILHGRRICKPKPLCDRCAVRDDCEYLPQGGRAGGSPTVQKDAGGSSPTEAGPRPRESAMNRKAFERLVEEALILIPRRFRDEMRNVAVVVEDEPSAELLADMEIEPGDTLFGLYQGTPLPERGWDYGNSLPDRISIYQGPIEDACETADDIRDCVAETVIHEFGHHFGMSEDEIEEIEEKFWRGDSIERD